MRRKSEPSGILRRGSACLSCRRRKLRCDGVRPVCQQCSSMKRSHECHFDDSSRKSRTQTLREKVFALEAKVRELEHGGSQSSAQSEASSSSSSATPISFHVDHRHPKSPALYQSTPSSWTSGELDPALPVEWLSMDYAGFDTQYKVPAGSSSDANPPMFLPLDTTISQYTNCPPAVSPVPFTDSSGTPAQDGPSDRLSEPILSLTVEMHNILIQTFIDHRKQCCFYSNTSRFDRSSSATVYQNTPPNSALMSAIYLMGCFFSQVPGLEKQLLDQTLHEITRSLHNQEQLMDVVQALCLLSQYFFFNDRKLEGTCHLTTAKRISVDFGLCQVPIVASSFDLGYPFDSASYDWEEKAAILWQVYMVEKLWSSSSDSCEVHINFEAPCQHVTTPLPVQDGVELEILAANSPLNDIFDGDEFRGSYLSATAFKVIASCIFDRSMRLHNTPPSSKDSATWLFHRSSEIALERLSSLVHPFTWRGSSRTENTTFDTDLYTVHTLILSSTIHLHLDNTMNLKISWAAKKLVELINHLSDDDYSYLDPVLSICWSSIVKIFLRMIRSANEKSSASTVSASTNSYTVAFLQHCVNILLNALQNLSNAFPIADSLLKSPALPALTDKPEPLPVHSGMPKATAPLSGNDFHIHGVVLHSIF